MSNNKVKTFKRAGGKRGRGRGRFRPPMRPANGTTASNGSDPNTSIEDDNPFITEEFISPIAKFMNVTKADESVARNYLSTCNDDLNEAIAMFCQSSSPFSSVTHSSPPTALATPQTAEGAVTAPPPLSPNTYEKTFGIRPPKPRVKERLVDEPQERNPYKRKLPDSIFSESYTQSNPSKKTKQLQELYKIPVDVTFKGTFDQAKNHAKHSNKWLIVNIQDVSDFRSHCINRDIWRNSVIRDRLENHFTLWQVYKDSPDACWYSRFYEVCSLPYIAILDSTTGKLLKEIQTINQEMFLATVEDFLCNFVMSSTQGVHNITADDEEFKAAINASLISSKQNGVVPNTDMPTSSKPPDDECIDENIGFSMPWIESQHTPLLIPEDSITQILLRCLDGSRRIVTFSQSQPIQALFHYLTNHGMNLCELEILSTYPRRVINHMDPLTSFKDANLAPSATLFIQFP